MRTLSFGWRSISLVAVLLLGGCASNVYFNQRSIEKSSQLESEVPESEKSFVFDIFMDHQGDYYPAPWVKGEASGLTAQKRDERWDDIQQGYILKVANSVVSALQSANTEGERPLVILIHGFNVDDANRVYAEVRCAVKNLETGAADPVFLQVHWDGRKTKGVRRFGAWSGAQATAPLVGLKLRPLLNAILEQRPKTPVRILTHSAGAVAVAALIGNSSSALSLADPDREKGCKRTYAHFCNHIRDNVGPFRPPAAVDLRIAMLAPATPPNSFSEVFPLSGHGVLAPNVTLIAGINPNDFATTKGFLPGSANPLGSTALSNERKSFCALRKGIERMRRSPIEPNNVTVHLLDFSNSTQCDDRTMLFWEKHDFSCYLKREKMGNAWKLLFNLPGATGDSQAYCN